MLPAKKQQKWQIKHFIIYNEENNYENLYIKLQGSNLVKQEIQEAKGKITRIMTLINLSNFKIDYIGQKKPEYIKG